MTLKPLDFNFLLVSPLSTMKPHLVTPQDMLDELDQEREHRGRFYQRMVAKGTLREEDAVRHIAVLIAIRADMGGYWDRSCTWDAKVRELRRELALRRNAWPKAIASPTHPLNSVEAGRRIARLEAIHWRYWMRGWFYEGDAAPGTAAARAELRALLWRASAWEGAHPDQAFDPLGLADDPDCRAAAIARGFVTPAQQEAA